MELEERELVDVLAGRIFGEGREKLPQNVRRSFMAVNSSRDVRVEKRVWLEVRRPPSPSPLLWVSRERLQRPPRGFLYPCSLLVTLVLSDPPGLSHKSGWSILLLKGEDQVPDNGLPPLQPADIHGLSPFPHAALPLSWAPDPLSWFCLGVPSYPPFLLFFISPKRKL